MTMRRSAWKVALLFLLLNLCSLRAYALTAGDHVHVFWRTTGGQVITGRMLKGHLLVVDFWATWCHPCMLEVPTVIKDYKKYSRDGVGFLGISLDNDVSQMRAVAKSKGIVWPQVCTGAAWQDPTATAWGVRAIPDTFIISGRGKVLWTGYPTQLASALNQMLKLHPTKIVMIRDAKKALAAAIAHVVKHKDIGGAIAELKTISRKIGRDRAMRQPIKKLLLAIHAAGPAAVHQIRASRPVMRVLAEMVGMGRVQTWLGPIQ